MYGNDLPASAARLRNILAVAGEAGAGEAAQDLAQRTVQVQVAMQSGWHRIGHIREGEAYGERAQALRP